MVLVSGGAVGVLIGLEVVIFAAAGFEPSVEVAEPLWHLGHFGVGVLVHVFTALFLGATLLEAGRDLRLAGAPRALAVVGVVGNAVMPFALFTQNADFIAGNVEHAIATLPWAAWTAIVGYRLLRSPSGLAPPAAL